MERRVREDMGGEANGGEGWETEVRGASRGGGGGGGNLVASGG